MALFERSKLEWGDYVAVAGYFTVVIIAGLWAAHVSRSRTLQGYFLASRSMHWIPVGASLFASNIGSEHFIGLAGSGAAGGIAIAVYELNAIFVLMLLGWVFAPVYISSGVFTMPEYIRKRFGGQRIRVFLSCQALILYIFTKISADLFSGALFIKTALDLKGNEGLYISILILLLLAAVFTIGGGLLAVIWTDFVQSLLMVVGSLVLTGLSIKAAGGYEKMLDSYYTSLPKPENSAFYIDEQTGENVSCSKVNENFMHLVRPVTDPSMPWTGYFTGVLISSIWYWCADQVIVQRTLAAKNINHAKGGCLLAGLLKLLPLFTLVMPGMAARVLFTDDVACSSPEKCQEICYSETGCTNIAYIRLVLDVMPHGLRGIMFAVMLAALMSSLTSIFNSAATIFTMDVYKRIIRSKPSHIELLLASRCFIVFLVAISIAWIPVIATFHSSQLFVYIQAVTNYLAPPVAAIYVLAILWPRLNELGAFWALITGFVVGIIRFGLEFGYKIPPCGSDLPDPRPEWIKSAVGNFHFLHFGGFSFVFTIVIAVIVSLLSKPIPKENLYRLTFWSRQSPKIRLKELDETDDEEDAEDDDNDGDNSNGKRNLHESPMYMKILVRLCCLRKKNKDVKNEGVVVKHYQKTREELAREAAEFLKEPEPLKSLCNGLLVLAVSCATFVWAFFA